MPKKCPQGFDLTYCQEPTEKIGESAYRCLSCGAVWRQKIQPSKPEASS